MDVTKERSRHDDGAAMVEFAIVITVLMLMLFGIVEFGRGYTAKTQVTGAVRDGARAAALGQTSTAVQTAVKASAPGVTFKSITVTACPGGGGGNATVVATSDWTYDIPLFGSKTKTITATGVMRCGG